MTTSPAEVAAIRHLVGLSQQQFADMLGVNVRTVRSWESGRDALAATSAAAVWALVERHDALVRQMLDADVPVAITRDLPTDATPARGWYLAAAGRALAVDRDLIVEWA